MIKNKYLKKKIVIDCLKSMCITIILYLICETFEGIISIFIANVIGEFADAIFTMNIDYGITQIWELLGCIFIIVFAMPLFNMLCESTMFSASLKHDRMIYKQFLEKNYASVIRLPASEIQYRVENDAIDMRSTLIDVVVKSITTIIMLILLLYNALSISWAFTIIVFLVSLIKLFVPIIVKKMQQLYDKETREYGSNVRNVETEMTKHACSVKIFGLKKFFLSKLNVLYTAFYKKIFKRKNNCNVISGSILSFLGSLCTLSILFVGAIMVSKNSITPGNVTTMIGYFAVFNTIIGNVDFLIRNIPLLKNTIDRMEALYSDKEIDGLEEIKEFDHLIFEKVSFYYDDKIVLDNLNFQVKSGEKVVICGKNGSGKSTLIKILCGLLKPQCGVVKINNFNLDDISLSMWRNKFSYVEQEPHLFKGSVLENIILGKDIEETKIAEIMKKIGISHLKERNVSSEGDDLSGGEKQKISIARALLRNTSILILDEPNNNLDVESRDWLYKFIKETEKTVVYVSHDDKFIELADKRIFL